MIQKYIFNSIKSGQIQKVNVATGGAGVIGNALVINAVDGYKYQLMDIVTLVSPAKLQIKRQGTDLQIALPGGGFDTPDVVIKGYFEAKGVALWGEGIDGEALSCNTNLGETHTPPGSEQAGAPVNYPEHQTFAMFKPYLTKKTKGMYLMHVCMLWFVLTSISQLSAQSINAPPQLTLYELLDNASDFYPSLRAARFESRASKEDTTAVSRQRWPTVTVTSETNTGNLRSYATQALQVQQTLWDFGRLSARIAEAEAAADVSLLNVYLQQQDLFLQIITAWQSMQSARERTRVALLTLERLKAYQAQMRRRVEAEASPRIDLELVDARLLQTEVELTTAQTALQLAVTRLELLSGLDRLLVRINAATPMPTLKSTLPFTRLISATDWLYIASEGPLVAKARAQLKQAQHRLDSKKSEAWPQVYARAYKPMNVIPSSSDTSTTTFVGLSYSPGAGFSTLAEAKALDTRISGAQLSVESALLEMQQTLQSDRQEYVNACLRIAALEKAVDGSDLVLASYKRQFEAGKKTWLDLLNAVRELAQNQYSLAEAQASMTGAMHRLQLRMGEQLQ